MLLAPEKQVKKEQNISKKQAKVVNRFRAGLKRLIFKLIKNSIMLRNLLRLKHSIMI